MSSRERKTEARAEAANPVKGAVEKTPRPPVAGPKTARDKVSGEPKTPSPLEGRKGDVPPTNPHERVDFTPAELAGEWAIPVTFTLSEE